MEFGNQLVVIPWFGDEIVGTTFHRFDRQLHIAEAREAIDFDTILPDYRTAYDPADPSTPIVECPYFTTRHIHTSEPTVIAPAEGSFTVVMVLEGSATIDGVDAPAGTTLLISADHGPATVTPAGPAVRLLTANA